MSKQDVLMKEHEESGNVFKAGLLDDTVTESGFQKGNFDENPQKYIK